jgi:iron complex outermembrane receptor protein
VTKVATTAQLAALNPAPSLFDRVNVLTLEQGQPKNKFSANMNWKLGQMGATLRATRYGKVLSPGTTSAFDVTLGAKTVVDLEARYALTPKLNLALGADNLLDAYPETLSPTVNTTGNTPFSTFSPFGFSGRFVYVRASYAF